MNETPFMRENDSVEILYKICILLIYILCENLFVTFPYFIDFLISSVVFLNIYFSTLYNTLSNVHS